MADDAIVSDSGERGGMKRQEQAFRNMGRHSNSDFKSRMMSRRRGLRRRRRTASTLRSRRRANEESALIWNWNNLTCTCVPGLEGLSETELGRLFPEPSCAVPLLSLVQESGIDGFNLRSIVVMQDDVPVLCLPLFE